MSFEDDETLRRLLHGAAERTSVPEVDLPHLRSRYRRRRQVRSGAAVVVVLLAGSGVALALQAGGPTTGQQRLLPAAPSLESSAPAAPSAVAASSATPGVPSTTPDSGAPALTVAACEAAHGLSSADDRSVVPLMFDAQGQAQGSGTFQTCVLPAPPGAAADGYTKITYATHATTDSEATNESAYDVVSGPCAVFALHYRYSNMGVTDDEPVQDVRTGARAMTSVDGVYRGDDKVPQPGNGQAVVAHNDSYTLENVTCSS